MKRRLDLALALVHGPRVLFLDEPTTGLDPQSRSALWDEVERLAREDGVTVFLTTQYLEEADVLADRVGIIDHGHIVAEGTPSALKAEIGGVSLEATPGEPERQGAPRGVARRVRRARGRQPARASPCASTAGAEALADVVRALDADGIDVAELQLHQPSLDDVFLEKTGRSLEGARGRRRGARAGGRDGMTSVAVTAGRPAVHHSSALHQVAPDRAPLGQPHVPPAGARHPGDPVPADPARGERGRAWRR